MNRVIFDDAFKPMSGYGYDNPRSPVVGGVHFAHEQAHQRVFRITVGGLAPIVSREEDS